MKQRSLFLPRRQGIHLCRHEMAMSLARFNWRSISDEWSGPLFDSRVSKMSSFPKAITDEGAMRANVGEPKAELNTIRCYLDSPLMRTAGPIEFNDENRLLTYQALLLFMNLETELKEARASWNSDRFRRLMRARSSVVSRLQRRWNSIKPQPRIPLGSLRRRSQANLAGYFYEPRQ